jgi:hypothetical protein
MTDTGVYFSIDGGVTNLQGFSSIAGGDLDDYNGSNPTDPYNASTGLNQAHHLNSVDITNLEVIGYDLRAAVVPEPATLARSDSDLPDSDLPDSDSDAASSN